MKFSPDTIAILKNFASIHNSIVVEPGSILSTRTPANNVIAVAEVTEEFINEFGIYDLAQFLSILSMFSDPLISFTSTKQAVISQDKSKVAYLFAEPSILQKSPKNVKDLEVIATFELSLSTYILCMKASSIMGLPQLLFEGDGDAISIAATNTALNNANQYRAELGETDKVFKAYVDFENFKIMPGSYNVQVSNRFLKMKNLEKKLTYWIALSKNSTFN